MEFGKLRLLVKEPSWGVLILVLVLFGTGIGLMVLGLRKKDKIREGSVVAIRLAGVVALFAALVLAHVWWQYHEVARKAANIPNPSVADIERQAEVLALRSEIAKLSSDRDRLLTQLQDRSASDRWYLVAAFGICAVLLLFQAWLMFWQDRQNQRAWQRVHDLHPKPSPPGRAI